MAKRKQQTSVLEPPASHESEKAVLGFMLSVKDPMASLQDTHITASDFHSRVHGDIFFYLAEQFRSMRRADMFDLYSKLSSDKAFQQIGGREYLETLRQSYQGKRRALEAAEEVRELARRRRLIEAGQHAVFRAADLSESFDSIQTDLSTAISQETTHQTERKPESSQEIAHRYLDYLERMTSQTQDWSIKSPFPDLEHYTYGFAPGEMVILAARTGCGKTALAINLLTHVAGIEGKPTGIFSLEMSQELICNRIFSSQCDVSLSRFRSGRFDYDEWRRIYEYGDTFKQLPLRINDQAGLRPTQFRERARVWKQQHDVQFLVLDYLQLMDPDRRSDKREREVAEASKLIKQTAVELGIPILVLCQLNREADKTGKPLLSQLRESGAIEQDADIILFIHPWQQDPSQRNVVVDMSVGKSRNSATGGFRLLYEKPFTRFLPYFGD